MAGNSAFQLVDERGWRRGLGNLMSAGFAGWWKTNTWWVQALIWTAVLNVLLAGVLWSPADLEVNEGAMLYSIFTGLFPTVAVIIIMQGEVVGEKQSGTAAWVLSKPVSRAAFIVAKLVPNALGMLATMLLMPGLVAYVQLSLAGAGVSPLGFLKGMGVLGINLLFYLTLTLMLGTLFSKRGGVISIPLAFVFGQQYLLGLIPASIKVLPWTLAVPVGDGIDSVSTSLMLGQTPHSMTPAIVTGVCAVLFVAIGLWRFEHEEF